MRFFAFGFRGIAVCLLLLCALLVSGNMTLAQTAYTNDTNIADFTANIGSYATLTNFNSSDGCVDTSSFTPTASELATRPCRVYILGTGNPVTGLPAGNWILATFSSPVSTVVVFPNIDHLGS